MKVILIYWIVKTYLRNNFVSTRKLSEDHNINGALKIDQDYIDIKKYRIWRIVQEQSYLYKNPDIFNL